MRINGSDGDLLEKYFDDIKDSEPLSREKEVELAKRIQENDDGDARDELVQANLRFVVDVARKYQNRGLSLLELISEGNVGLITAAERFDGTRGYKFISYAVWWVRQSILQALMEQATPRVPINQLNLLYRIKGLLQEPEYQSGKMPSIEEIASELEEKVENVKRAYDCFKIKSPLRLDAPVRDDSDRTYYGIFRNEVAEDPEEVLERRELGEVIDGALDLLDSRERTIIRKYFGLIEGGEPMTLEEIGKDFGLTRERIRQLKDRGLDKIREGDGVYAEGREGLEDYF